MTGQKEKRGTEIERAARRVVLHWPAEHRAGRSSRRRVIDYRTLFDRPQDSAAAPRRAPSPGNSPPMARKVVFRAGLIRTLSRLCLWAWGGTQFYAGNLYDRIRARGSVRSRAVRLRTVLESLGTTFIKLGQQLSLRADILRYEYCEELGRMLDDVPPFSSTVAIAVIERNLGTPLNEVFDEFDPQPVGSASVACVYRAKLKTGEQVAVKVRRPGIVEELAADLRALDWLLMFAESLTLLRPGLTENFRSELRSMLLSELNFRKEARFTDMFGRFAKEQQLYATSPKVYFQYSTEEVLVTEFIAGMSMWELISAVDANDQAKLEEARAMGIHPRKIARRLARDVYTQMMECPFFHADPHPANLVVLPDSRICFVDFASCGHFSSKMRSTWRQLHFHMLNNDIGRMASCALNLAEPLPRIDVEKFKKMLDNIIADWMYATKSKDAEWWERSTSYMWINYVQVAREFGVPINLETLQYFRATLLYDSVIMRLDTKFDVVGQYRRYTERAGRRARSRLEHRMFQRLGGPEESDYLRVEELVDLTNQFLHRAHHLLESPAFSSTQMTSKLTFAVLKVNQTLWIAVVVVALFCFGYLLWNPAMDGTDVARAIVTPSAAWWLYLFLFGLGIVQLRKVLMRIRDVDDMPS